MSDVVGKKESPRIFTLGDERDRFLSGLRFAREDFMLCRAECKKKFRLMIEERCVKSARLAGANEIVEVDVRREVLLSGIGEEIARDAMMRIRSRGAEASRTFVKQLRLAIAVVERDDESTFDEIAQLVDRQASALSNC